VIDPDRLSRLSTALWALDAGFDRAAAVRCDPLGLVRQLPPPQREVGAHVAAMLSYGAVSQIRRVITDVFDAADGDLVGAAGAPGRFWNRLGPYRYRMTEGTDIVALLTALGELLQRHGSLERAWAAGDPGSGDVRDGLVAYVTRLRVAAGRVRQARGTNYLLADPSTGSATKRWYMLLRWLVRPDDGADLGLWQQVGASRLVLPLDTHTSRLSRWLGLTERKTVDYLAARQSTDVLARVNATDPVRFDMPLCHLGISGACEHRFVEPVCSACPLNGLCVFTRA
jgi:uncharacterized protein (TIGR02757 family)